MLALCDNCQALRGFYKWDCVTCIAYWLLGEPRIVVRREVLDFLKKKEPGLARKAKELVTENWESRRFARNITYEGPEK